MATENIVLLACAAVLCTLHVAGGPLSGLFRKPPPRRRTVVRGPDDRLRARAEPESMPPTVGTSAPMTNVENEVISRAS
jgi:hypothetical protein